MSTRQNKEEWLGIHEEGNLKNFTYKVLFSVMKAGIVKNFIDTCRKLNVCT